MDDLDLVAVFNTRRRPFAAFYNIMVQFHSHTLPWQREKLQKVVEIDALRNFAGLAVY
jgi:hypothetical protein